MAGSGNRHPILADARLHLASLIRELLDTLAAEMIASPIAPFLEGWAPEGRQLTPGGSHRLPVLRWMADFSSDEQAIGRSLIAELCRVAPQLAWRQTYTVNEVGEDFLRCYGYTEILSASDPLLGEGRSCGFLVLGPATHYPSHQHAAEEIYVPLSGAARWQQGNAPWRERRPGTVIHHASLEPHAMSTGAEPLLALYLWRGRTTSSRLC